MIGQSSPSPDDEAGEFWFDSGDMSYAVVDDETKHYLVLDPTGLREQIARAIYARHGISSLPWEFIVQKRYLDTADALLAGFAAGQGTT